MKKIDEEKLRQDIICSISGDCVPDIRGNIKQAFLEKQEKKKKKHKKIGWALGLAVPVGALGIVLGITLPMTLNRGSNPVDPGGSGGGGSNPFTPQVLTPEAKHADVAWNVASGASFLTTEAYESALPAAKAILSMRSSFSNASNNVLEEHLLDVNPFMLTAERMMNEEELIGEITYDESAEYPYSMTLENGGSLSYKETRIPNKEDDEESFSLEGELSYEDEAYSVSGKRESEVEGDEQEYETSFRVNLDEGTYLLLESENEKEQSEFENSYSYTYVENRQTTLEVALSYESEDGKEELSIEVETIGKEAEYVIDPIDQTSWNLRYEFETESESEDDEDGDEQEYSGTMKVSISGGGDYYEYSENGAVIATLPRK